MVIYLLFIFIMYLRWKKKQFKSSVWASEGGCLHWTIRQVIRGKTRQPKGNDFGHFGTFRIDYQRRNWLDFLGPAVLHKTVLWLLAVSSLIEIHRNRDLYQTENRFAHQYRFAQKISFGRRAINVPQEITFLAHEGKPHVIWRMNSFWKGSLIFYNSLNCSPPLTLAFEGLFH